jgi:hypothetical protein
MTKKNARGSQYSRVSNEIKRKFEFLWSMGISFHPPSIPKKAPRLVGKSPPPHYLRAAPLDEYAENGRSEI